MKKIISLLIASAMVVSLVPATAFAGQDVSATAKVVGAQTLKEVDGSAVLENAAELQITVASAAYSGKNVVGATGYEAPTMELEISLDDAKFDDADYEDANGDPLFAYDITGIYVENGDGDKVSTETTADATLLAEATRLAITVDIEKGDMLVKLTGHFSADDVIIIPLDVVYNMDAGDYATVSIDSDMVEADDLVFLTISDTGMEASIKDLTMIAEDEVAALEEKIVIEETVADTFNGVQWIEMELSKGFEFDTNGNNIVATCTEADSFVIGDDDNEAIMNLDDGANDGKITIKDLGIVVDGADEGDIATIEMKLYATVNGKAKKLASCEVEVAEVCDYTVKMSVDEDEDVPVFYNGVNSTNDGLTDDADHMSLEVTIVESFPGAWEDKEFELTLPDGVYVTEVEINKNTINWDTDAYSSFEAAYEEGDYKGFVFEKRVFTENDPNNSVEDVFKVQFELELVAEPTFEGEVVLGLVGDSVTEGEVVIAEFVAPFTATAEQNDVIIDYRDTLIETPIVITEADAELWEEDLVFSLSMESYIDFDDAGDITVSEDSAMEIKTSTSSSSSFDGTAASIDITIKEESDDEAAVITIENMTLYMNRSLAAGSYDLDICTSASEFFMEQAIFAGYEGEDAGGDATNTTKVQTVGDAVDEETGGTSGTIGYTVNEAFVNIVTAGRDQDDTFLTQVIVPIGESYIFAGGKQIDLDVPAYISEAGYTMLPVRAVSSALGIDTNAVQWNAEARQVTIIYSGKVIAMTIGESYMTVNGTAIATSAAPEITDSRTFLPLRDLATALSVSISWDDATKTATFN
ncbi:copper amine oxidase N-terminal domain-containing protein [Chakrabartyella piscis]|uniref:copper amine oxidase N-terminal domain-containing protein n=1 Tax=Chakrabartyella piscis TaxID=2918914 RepID=UPI002958C816|nr:copper amine oxidase N-terminal domain-containing protein [Chakrabartyella piscis]